MWATFSDELANRSRAKRIKKKQELRPLIRKWQVRLMYSYGDSMEDIAKQLRMSLKTIRKIIRSYKNVRVGDLEIDAQVINRSKSHSKYSNENSIVNFIREYASSPTFDRTFTCKKLIKVLNSKFGPKQSFKKSTTYKLIHAAGLRRKKMNFNFYPKSSTLSSVNIR